MNFDSVTNFTMPTRIIYGYGTAGHAGAEAKKLGADKALVVTDAGIVKAGVVEPVLKSLRDAGVGYEVFTEVPEDPGTEVVARATEVLQQNGCNLVVIVGGGSPLCAGKGVALVATNGGNIRDYEGFDRYQKAPLPVLGIPTTAGSGSEVSAAFIITDEQRNYKMTIGGYECHPKVAILDPLLLRTLPAGLMLVSGMDALTHAIEAMCTNQATPLTDAIALDSIIMMLDNLPAAAFSDNLEAKGAQLLASAMANIACGNAKLGLVHAMSQPLGSYHLSHGLANGILLPYVMEFNLPACEGQIARIARAAGLEGTRSQLAIEALKLVKELFVKTGFPDRLPEDKVPRQDIPQMAKIAMGRTQYKLNLRRATEKELIEIYEKAFSGWEN